MQITLFYGCYYSSPSVKRASHTLVGPLVLLCHVPAALVPNYFRLLIPLSFAESARLFFSTSGHSSLTPPPPTRMRCREVPFTTWPPDVLGRSHPPGLTCSTLVPVCSHTCISLCHSVVYDPLSSLKSLPATSSFSIA